MFRLDEGQITGGNTASSEERITSPVTNPQIVSSCISNKDLGSPRKSNADEGMKSFPWSCGTNYELVSTTTRALIAAGGGTNSYRGRD
ncbi:hypothetical protein ARMSODRAFT_805188 [Armillaria solidipes]|uniref:Uncharacterized protein n=1 Tax=Armillaria solidipes TaxID=1076256 RepID=A0A2H3AK57_9AGAR|nr:hypothetical protein ARMSODRAFT_805188 [Armillaria solidipes]